MNDRGNTRCMAAVMQAIDPGDRLAAGLRLGEQLRNHGADPCTRAQAAAHETGHFIVGKAALGHVYAGIRIYRHGSDWLGRCQIPFDAGVNVADANSFLAAVAQNLGGFIGELVAGLAHANSSLDERLYAEGMANAYALAHAVPAEGVSIAAGSLALVAIQRNRPVFDDLRRRLEKDKKLDRRTLAAAAGRIRAVEVPGPAVVAAFAGVDASAVPMS